MAYEINVGKGFKLLDCDVFFTLPGESAKLVGGVKSLDIKGSGDNSVNHQAGSVNPAEIVRGKKTFSGTLDGFWWDNESLTDYVDFSGDNDIYFDISGTVKTDPNGSERIVNIKGVKIRDWNLTMNQDDTSSISRDFDALSVEFK